MKLMFGLVALFIPTALMAEDLPDRWISTTSRDRLDGTATISALSPARSVTYFPQRRPAEMNKIANLWVMCSAKKTIVYIELRNQLLASESIRVSYRFDEGKPVKNQRWQASADSTATGFWGGKNAINLAKAIENSRTMFVRTEHDVFGMMEATFETSNAKKYFEPIRKECGW